MAGKEKWRSVRDQSDPERRPLVAVSLYIHSDMKKALRCVRGGSVNGPEKVLLSLLCTLTCPYTSRAHLHRCFHLIPPDQT